MQIWPWSTEWSRAKANRALPRECTGHSKHPLPTTQEKTLKGYCWITMPGFLAPGGEEFNPGPKTRLDHSELLCNKVLLKYKGDRESFWHRHQMGEKEYPLLVFSWMLYCHKQPVNERKECLKTQTGARPLTHKMYFGIILAPNDSSWAIKWLIWILKKGRSPYK